MSEHQLRGNIRYGEERSVREEASSAWASTWTCREDKRGEVKRECKRRREHSMGEHAHLPRRYARKGKGKESNVREEASSARASTRTCPDDKRGEAKRVIQERKGAQHERARAPAERKHEVW